MWQKDASAKIIWSPFFYKSCSALTFAFPLEGATEYFGTFFLDSDTVA